MRIKKKKSIMQSLHFVIAPLIIIIFLKNNYNMLLISQFEHFSL